MGLEKEKYLRGVLEPKSTEDLQKILEASSGYSKETVSIARMILRKRGQLSNKTEEPQKNTNFVGCPDCGNMVSKRAEKCPICGASVKKILQWRFLWGSIPTWGWFAFVGIFILLIVVGTIQESGRRRAEIERERVLKQEAEAREQKAKEERAKRQKERDARVEESMVNARELLDNLVSRSGAIFGFWSQPGSAWIKVPAKWANDKPSCREYAELAAKFLSSKLGYMVCVHLYYGDQNEITNVCR